MNPYQKGTSAFKKAAVTTNDQGTLILMLYDGSIRFLKSAILKLSKNDLEGAHNSIIKAKDIVSELMGSLDNDNPNELVGNLRNLYTYMFNRLIDANVKKDAAMCQEVCALLEELREGWRTAVNAKKSGSNVTYAQQRGATRPIDVRG